VAAAAASGVVCDDAVEEMDLDAFYAVYRVDGRSRPPYDPAMMVALLLYAYARGIRSSRVIERACEEDVAFRVLAAQQRPDHATLARFVERHQEAICGLFGEVLALCARSGLANVGVIAVDGTKVQANASRNENLDYEQLAREIVEEAKAVDAAEDELYGEARGDELPPEFSTAQGRREWLREAKQRLEAERAANPQPVPRSRPKRLKEAKRRLEEELWTEVRANRAYEAYRARGRMKDGRRFGRPPDPSQQGGSWWPTDARSGATRRLRRMRERPRVVGPLLCSGAARAGEPQVRRCSGVIAASRVADRDASAEWGAGRGTGASPAVSGARRRSVAQLRSPSQAMAPGSRMVRTTVASSRTANASPTPSCFIEV
jgi:transposase